MGKAKYLHSLTNRFTAKRDKLDKLKARYSNLEASPGYNPHARPITNLQHCYLNAIGERNAHAKQRQRKYGGYLQSPAWKAKRIEILAKRGVACERCQSAREIQVHHLTYARVGKELDSDLAVLCENCHRQEHGLPTREALREQYKLGAEATHCPPRRGVAKYPGRDKAGRPIQSS